MSQTTDQLLQQIAQLQAQNQQLQTAQPQPQPMMPQYPYPQMQMPVPQVIQGGTVLIPLKLQTPMGSIRVYRQFECPPNTPLDFFIQNLVMQGLPIDIYQPRNNGYGGGYGGGSGYNGGGYNRGGYNRGGGRY